MIKRRPKIGWLQRGNIGDDRLQIIQGQCDRNDGRRAIHREGVSDVLDLRKRRVRVEGKEGGKAVLPVTQAAQRKEGRRRSDGIHPVRRNHHMTTPTQSPRLDPARHRIPVITRGFGNGLILRRQAEQSRTVHLKAYHGPATHLRTDPFAKPQRTGVTAIGHRKMPALAQPVKHRNALRAKAGISLCGIINQFNAHLGFERETRQHVFQHPAFDQGGRRIEAKFPFICNGLPGANGNGNQGQKEMTQAQKHIRC